jgi:hypothetical protein
MNVKIKLGEVKAGDTVQPFANSKRQWTVGSVERDGRSYRLWDTQGREFYIAAGHAKVLKVED